MADATWPIIIGGCHRSGTSLVRRILNAHSRIHCGPEVKFFREWYGDYIVEDPVRHTRFFTSARSILPDGDLFEIFGRAFVEMHERAAENAGKQRWADKSPENVLYLKEWESMLGSNWLFLHVVRNPLDTLASIAEADFKYAILPGLEPQIDHYKRYAEAGLAYERSLPERCNRVIYEKLVASPWAEIERLMQWLGEAAERLQLDFNSIEHQRGLEDPKIGRTRGFHVDSIGRWKSRLQRGEAEAIVGATGRLWQDLDTNSTYPLDRAMQETGPGSEAI
jgi:hypothetical protein